MRIRLPALLLIQNMSFLQLQVPVFQRHMLEKNINANAEPQHRSLRIHKLLLHDSQLRNLRLQVHETTLKRGHSKENLGPHLPKPFVKRNALPLLHHLRLHLLRLRRLIQLPPLSQLLLYLQRTLLLPNLCCHLFGSGLRIVRVQCCSILFL